MTESQRSATARDSFAALINRGYRASPAKWGGLHGFLAEAARKTQCEPARAAILQLLAETKDVRTRAIAIDALRLSPGDVAWLRRAKESIHAVRPVGSDDDLARQQNLATEWLDSRVHHPQ